MSLPLLSGDDTLYTAGCDCISIPGKPWVCLNDVVLHKEQKHRVADAAAKARKSKIAYWMATNEGSAHGASIQRAAAPADTSEHKARLVSFALAQTPRAAVASSFPAENSNLQKPQPHTARHSSYRADGGQSGLPARSRDCESGAKNRMVAATASASTALASATTAHVTAVMWWHRYGQFPPCPCAVRFIVCMRSMTLQKRRMCVLRAKKYCEQGVL